MERILIATDFSKSADNATNYAIELAKFFDSEISLLNSYPIPIASLEGNTALGDVITLLMETSEKGLRETKEKIEAKYQQRFNIKYYSQIGFAEDAILEVAKKINADLIVMGIVGGNTKSKIHPIGSTAIKVARNTDIPVFIIPDEAIYHPIKKISFACNLNKTEESDLIYVTRYFTKTFNAELEIINIEKPDKEFTEEKLKTYAVIEQKLATTQHKSVFITGKNAGKALEKYFKNHATDVIMINPRKHDLFHNLFSQSVAKDLAFHSKYPLLCIH